MSKLLIRFGFLVLALCVAVVLANELWPESPLASELTLLWINYALASGGALIASGMVLGVLFKSSSLVIARRCARCRRRVNRGEVYCPDHLKQSVQEAVEQDRMEESRHRLR